MHILNKAIKSNMLLFYVCVDNSIKEARYRKIAKWEVEKIRSRK